MTFREMILDDDFHEPDLDALYRAGQELREEHERQAAEKLAASMAEIVGE